MKFIPLIFWFLISCAGHNYHPPDYYHPRMIELVPDTTGVITLIGYNGQGHACPVEDRVYSARHLLESRFSWGLEMNRFMWADGDGGVGWARAIHVDRYQDIGLLEVQKGEPKYYKEGLMPKVGDKVWYVNFEEEGDRAFLDDPTTAVISHMRAGYIFFKDEAPRFGSSGSCLLNSANEAIGVVVWGIGGKEKEGGAAVLLPDPEKK